MLFEEIEMFLNGSRIEQEERLNGEGKVPTDDDFMRMRRNVSGGGLVVALLE